jgi:hypothetical protein
MYNNKVRAAHGASEEIARYQLYLRTGILLRQIRPSSEPVRKVGDIAESSIIPQLHGEYMIQDILGDFILGHSRQQHAQSEHVKFIFKFLRMMSIDN